MTKPLNWKLSVSPFTLADKARISAFLFTEPMWTYGKHVRDYERLWERQFGVKHAIMVSSGSTANELIALHRKHELVAAGQWPAKNRVVFPVNTWISSVSVWVNLGFEPVFMDVSPDNLNATYDDVLAGLKAEGALTLFYTALLGFHNDLDAIKNLCVRHGVRFLMDNCEASFSSTQWPIDAPWGEMMPKCRTAPASLLSLTTCSTSIFFSHFTTSGTEGGLIFTENDDEADWYRMARSHGLTRGMPDRYKNPNVNADFDFYLMGSNYRSSNLQAYMASLDFQRAYDWSMANRRQLFRAVNDNLSTDLFDRFQPGASASDHELSIPLSLPIMAKTPEIRARVQLRLAELGCLCRPLVAGSLLRHSAFKGYGDPTTFPVADHSHSSHLYVGLNPSITLDMCDRLVSELNAL